jgi:hypothetical protein
VVATVASLNRRVAGLNRQHRSIYQRMDEAAKPAAARRGALDLAAELGVTLDQWQQDALSTATHDLLLLVTRQGGKGEVATFLALDQLVNVPGSTTVVVSKAERQAKRLLRRIKRRYRQLADVSAPLVDNQYEFGLGNGAEVLALPGSEETIRGIEAVDLLIVDEAALVSEELFNAVYPMLASTNGRCVAMSTARGARGWFWRAFVGSDPDWHRTKVTWRDIPRFTAEFIERVRRRFGEMVFLQEFECAFIGEGSVFRKVAEAATAERQDDPIQGHAYLTSVDWGKLADWTVITTWDLTTAQLVHIDRFQQIDYTLQVKRLQAICERFRPQALAPERNSMGEPIIEQLVRAPWCPPVVMPFLTTNASKALAVEAFALALEQGTVKILDDPALVGELHAFEGIRLPSGLIRYQAPEGTHDDAVMACVIGWWSIVGGSDEPDTVVYEDRVSISPI